MIRRVAVIGAVALVVAGLFQLDDPHTVEAPATSPIVGAAFDPDSSASTWYCAAAPDPLAPGVAADVAHQIVITNPGDEVTARITGYGTQSGSAVASTAVVAAQSQHVVSMADVGPGLGGVTVEITGGPVTVAHRLVGSRTEDESECVTEASDRWYFPSANTELDRASNVEAGAHVWLLNPFPTDASVDIRVTAEDVVRIPTELNGLIVPAGSSRMVDLTAVSRRHPQLAFAVEARGGRVVAELAQTVPGAGLRLEPGVDRAAPTWMLADSFGGTALGEQLHVYNPSSSDVTATVTVMPDGVDAASLPEPFVLEIPGRRFATVDLPAEPRVPPESLRWIRIDTIEGAGVVPSQVVTVTGPGGDGTAATRPSVAGGLASSSGSTSQATTWYLTSMTPTTDSQPVVVIANPSPDKISVVTLRRIAAGATTPIAEKLEVPPSGLRVVDVSAATADGPIGVVVTASTPVVVAGRTTSAARAELSMFPGVPDRATVSELPAGG